MLIVAIMISTMVAVAIVVYVMQYRAYRKYKGGQACGIKNNEAKGSCEQQTEEFAKNPVI